jgi:hypothetical protein
MNQISKLLDILFAASAFGLFICGISILTYQIYFYAKNGVWLHISIANVYESNWLQVNWIGVHNVLDWVPASIACFAIAWIVLQIGIKLLEGER